MSVSCQQLQCPPPYLIFHLFLVTLFVSIKLSAKPQRALEVAESMERGRGMWQASHARATSFQTRRLVLQCMLSHYTLNVGYMICHVLGGTVKYKGSSSPEFSLVKVAHVTPHVCSWQAGVYCNLYLPWNYLLLTLSLFCLQTFFFTHFKNHEILFQLTTVSCLHTQQHWSAKKVH